MTTIDQAHENTGGKSLDEVLTKNLRCLESTFPICKVSRRYSLCRWVSPSHLFSLGRSYFVHFRLFRPFSSELRPISSFSSFSSFSSMDEVFRPKLSKQNNQFISSNISGENERGGSDLLRPFSSMDEMSNAEKARPIRVLCQGIEKEPIRFLIRILFYQTDCPIVAES